jgi:hypothetical protein
MKTKLILASLMVISVLTLTNCGKKYAEPKKENHNKLNNSYDFRTDKKIIELNKHDIKTSQLSRTYEGVDMDKINAIYNLSPASNRIAALSLLNADEKFACWDNLTNLKIENIDLNQDQKQLLIDFHNLVLMPFMYFDNSDAENARNSLENSLPDVLNQMNNAGIETETFIYVYYSTNLNNLNYIPSNTINGGNQHNCSCNRGSIINVFKMQNCSDDCTIQTNCGFLGMFTCNGRPWANGPSGTKQYLDAL